MYLWTTVTPCGVCVYVEFKELSFRQMEMGARVWKRVGRAIRFNHAEDVLFPENAFGKHREGQFVSCIINSRFTLSTVMTVSAKAQAD